MKKLEGIKLDKEIHRSKSKTKTRRQEEKGKQFYFWPIGE